ncbi:hypothetical protein M885DRAFT_532336 [Pelagophyceae sp. CCMP2097]|nr:hypothetical protein M885DRAFT_532336 [Pelagophyceae sp. CCMP2097]|mmetsp:Transcript_1195/g.3699  ORF Transcript_1195/g.3699 Transcript_1195/m.3699 type:complete len:129 (-) Transcript_1195:84-470(-)|eukprot:CAMPEP_0184085422 /NCGR_PEP_ID=MMETSP0974-20121125/4700_1 /TAXON_ID=483370 /ORGANISM="non described non described, Strain CCMP2097" /LENGTH=128 /DNA_ID=CAMNT_0026388101 /DNA_START=66 /DNA_END=452 /DNA_ORIENTATION=+
MAMRFTKKEANILIKIVTKIQISFDPFCDKSRNVREFWKRVSSPKIKQMHPKLDVEVDMRRGSKSRIHVAFIDAANPLTIEAPSPDTDVMWLLSTTYSAALAIENDYLINSKPGLPVSSTQYQYGESS